MLDDIEAVLRRSGRVASRHRLLQVATRGVIDGELRRGRLSALLPGVYCRPWDAEDQDVIDRAAVIAGGRGAVLSHATALRRHGVLAESTPTAAHVTIPHLRRIQPQPGRTVVHRQSGAYPAALWLRGLPTFVLPVALVQSWSTLGEARVRPLMIDAVRNRSGNVASLRSAAAPPKTAGRRAILALCDLLAAGCESELEIYGLLRVFTGPGLGHGRRQFVVKVAGRYQRVDLAFEKEQVCVELDGRVGHAGDAGRERDTRRDARLAAAGWLTVRFTYARLVADPDGCRCELLAVLAARRQQFGVR